MDMRQFMHQSKPKTVNPVISKRYSYNWRGCIKPEHCSIYACVGQARNDNDPYSRIRQLCYCLSDAAIRQGGQLNQTRQEPLKLVATNLATVVFDATCFARKTQAICEGDSSTPSFARLAAIAIFGRSSMEANAKNRQTSTSSFIDAARGPDPSSLLEFLDRGERLDTRTPRHFRVIVLLPCPRQSV